MFPRPEYPRPQFVRDTWLCLNGEWDFAFDDWQRGLQERWFDDSPAFDRRITVPFPYQSVLSGIADTGFHDLVWYRRAFDLPDSWLGKRIILHFGAVDYRAWVWLNGVFVAYHEGGHTPFSADITELVNPEDNTLVVRVEDPADDRSMPRGKQYWEKDSASIFYTRTTGIWQTVWLEPVGNYSLKRLQITPDLDAGSVNMHYLIDGEDASRLTLETEISYNGQLLIKGNHLLEGQQRELRQTFPLDSQQPIATWSPEAPNLYDVTVRMSVLGQVIDEVTGYFGMRKVSVQDGQVMLNNAPYYMKLVLDQGYHPDGILSFPTDDAIKADVEITKALGFNGARKHQKVEDPRYLYWADQLGLLVWGEMANAYLFTPQSVNRLTTEWQAAIMRDYNHPCIVAWVPINESWGVPDLKSDARQRHVLQALYHLTHTLDSTRLVISNDGWEHATSDLLTLHDYENDPAVLRPRYAALLPLLGEARQHERPPYVPGFSYDGQPILVTEFGGIGYQKSDEGGWGYATAHDDDDFLARYRGVVEALLASPLVQGFCYTQLTDVEQEINGLLTYDRQPKVDPALIRAINELPWSGAGDGVQ